MIKAISKRPKFYHPFKGNMLKEYAKKLVSRYRCITCLLSYLLPWHMQQLMDTV